MKKKSFLKLHIYKRKKPKCFLFCPNTRFKSGTAIEGSYGQHLCLNPTVRLPIVSPWKNKEAELEAPFVHSVLGSMSRAKAVLFVWISVHCCIHRGCRIS